MDKEVPNFMGKFKKIDRCRICGNANLVQVLDLGEQMLTGVFPKIKDGKITRGPLRLVKCQGQDVCGLLQLAHSYNSGEMYGENYGYRSGLNPSMVRHLQDKVRRILSQIKLDAGDLVVDIGSNDGTTLRAYPSDLTLIGFDPAGVKFEDCYSKYTMLICEFFSASLLRRCFSKKAKVVTSFSMFYDLEDPTGFMAEIHEVLHEDGIWVFEQSYMPSMLETNSYDTVCHEHLEFYALKQIKFMADRVGFIIRCIEFNDVNGGSISVTMSKTGPESPDVQKVLDKERELGLDTIRPYFDFGLQAAQSKQDLLEFIKLVRSQGCSVAALGASTKGNVLLQYCGLTEKNISYIGEVNPDKFGSYTPGSGIPIIPESRALAMKPDYLIVLPWHFRKFFVENPKYAGQRLVFPLPKLEVV